MFQCSLNPWILTAASGQCILWSAGLCETSAFKNTPPADLITVHTGSFWKGNEETLVWNNRGTWLFTDNSDYWAGPTLRSSQKRHKTHALTRKNNRSHNPHLKSSQMFTRHSKLLLTSARQTLVSFFLRVLALFKAFLLFSTGTLIMGVLMLELATIRISLSLQARARCWSKVRRLLNLLDSKQREDHICLMWHKHCTFIPNCQTWNKICPHNI